MSMSLASAPAASRTAAVTPGPDITKDKFKIPEVTVLKRSMVLVAAECILCRQHVRCNVVNGRHGSKEPRSCSARRLAPLESVSTARMSKGNM